MVHGLFTALWNRNHKALVNKLTFLCNTCYKTLSTLTQQRKVSENIGYEYVNNAEPHCMVYMIWNTPTSCILKQTNQKKTQHATAYTYIIYSQQNQTPEWDAVTLISPI